VRGRKREVAEISAVFDRLFQINFSDSMDIDFERGDDIPVSRAKRSRQSDASSDYPPVKKASVKDETDKDSGSLPKPIKVTSEKLV
jgi:hypothetical protein